MKLYYKPGACSLASHIALRESGSDFALERVDTEKKTTEQDADFLAINPKGYVPALALDDGTVLTEGAAILQFIADRNPASGLAPQSGGLERVRLQEHLNYVASELHKAFGPLFTPGVSESEKTRAKAKVAEKLDYIETLLADGRNFLLGGDFSVADAYLFVVTNWTGPTGISTEAWPRVTAFQQRVAARVAVQEALKAEGLTA